MVQWICLQIGCHLCLVHYPRETRRRRKCAAVPSIFGMAQRSAAPFVTESLVSSATTPGEPPSVQGSALIASRPAGRLTADGYAGFKPPDNGCSESHLVLQREPLAVIDRCEQVWIRAGIIVVGTAQPVDRSHTWQRKSDGGGERARSKDLRSSDQSGKRHSDSLCNSWMPGGSRAWAAVAASYKAFS